MFGVLGINNFGAGHVSSLYYAASSNGPRDPGPDNYYIFNNIFIFFSSLIDSTIHFCFTNKLHYKKKSTKLV